jgi:hypothetical protein
MSQPWEIVQAKEDNKGSSGRSSVSSDFKNKSIEENTDAELWLGHSVPKDGFKLMETMKEGCKVLGLLSLLVGQEDDHEEMHLAPEEDGHSLLKKLKLEGDEIQASLDLYPGPM